MSTPGYELLNNGDEGEVKVTAGLMEEIGDTGLKRAAGVIDEEFLPALRGRKAIKVFKEMSLNDPTVGSLLFAIEQLLRQVEWTVISDDSTPEGQEAVEFVESCMEDMSHTWSDMVAEIISFITYGWSWHEIVYKKRVGPWEKDPAKRSKHTDGRYGWRKIPIRSQETFMRWIFDEDGGVKGMVQMPPPTYTQRTIPIERSLLFRARQSKGSPEGISLLRNAYRPWFFKKRLEEFEAIGVERDLAGMPVARVPSDYIQAPKGSNKHRTYQAFKKMVQNVRRDEHEGLVIPKEIDPDTKQDLFDFELMSSGGARTFDTNALITRYEQRILMTVLADFIMLGSNQTGSYAMHVDKTGIFRAALNAMANVIADTFNRHAIPRLFEVNGWKPEHLPKIKPSNVDPPNLTELAGFMSQMSALGMQFFPDPDLEKYLRNTAHLPELPEEVLEMRREMADQQNMQQMMEQSMQAAGIQTKAQMVESGMTPEQAEMASQQQTPEMMEQEQTGAQLAQMRAQNNPEVLAEQEALEGRENEKQQAQQAQEQEAQMASQREEMMQRIAQAREQAAQMPQPTPRTPWDREEAEEKSASERMFQFDLANHTPQGLDDMDDVEPENNISTYTRATRRNIGPRQWGPGR